MAVASKVKRLNLSGNRFFQLFNLMNYFPGMGMTLKELVLKKCFIIHIEDGFFNKLHSLETLDLSENELRSVPSAIRRPNIRKLNLSKQCWPLYVCIPYNFNLTSDSFAGMDRLIDLDISRTLTTVPENAFKGAQYLETLDLSFEFLQTIHKNAFLTNNRLRKLRCHQCWLLQPIHYDLWTTVYNLEELDLSFSPHSIVPKSNSHLEDKTRKVSLMLPNLRYLNLTCSLAVNNTLCDQGLYHFESPLDPNLLKPLVKLETLDLSKNGLTSWTSRRLQDNPRS